MAKTRFATRDVTLASGRMGEEIRLSELHMGQFGSKGGLRRMVPLKKDPKTVTYTRTPTISTVPDKAPRLDSGSRRIDALGDQATTLDAK